MRIIIQDTKHLKLRQDLLWVGTATLVTVIIWVVYAVYTAFNQTTIDSSIDKLLVPLNPSLDQAALAKLDDRFTPPADFTVLVLSPDNEAVVVPQASADSPASTPAATVATPTPLITPPVGQDLF